jgi:two-component system, chemotaxis family, chemotaxis protein CheY
MSGETGAIKLPAVLDLSAAESFLASLLHASEMGEPLVLDASAVESITTPCVQIILSAKRTDSPASVVPPAPPDSDLPEMETEDIQPAAFNPPEVPAESTPEAIQTEMDTTDMAKRILTIDDSKTMRDMLMLTLSDAGYDVVQAVDGQDGIEVLGDRKVDVVITDINMPKMDGYAVIRNLRANPVHKSTPILVLTTESDTEKKNLARDAGATGWMVKPFDPDQLVATIRKVAP